MTKNKYLLPYLFLFVATILIAIEAGLVDGNLSGISKESYFKVAFLCIGTSFLNAIIIYKYYGLKKALLLFISLSSAVFFSYDPLNPGSLSSSLHVLLGYFAFGVYALTIIYHLYFHHRNLLNLYLMMLGIVAILYVYFLSVVGLMEVIFLCTNLLYFYLFSISS